MSANFPDIRISLVNKDKLRAIASCKVAGLVWLIGMRVVESDKGPWVAMPSRKNKKGEFQDYYFPASKQVRGELTDAVLAAYIAKRDQQEAGAA